MIHSLDFQCKQKFCYREMQFLQEYFMRVFFSLFRNYKSTLNPKRDLEKGAKEYDCYVVCSLKYVWKN